MAVIGTVKRGKASVFGGPNDPTDSGHTATGVPTSVPGIAVLDTSTKGGYWLLQAPNGRIRVVKQTDYGPAGWTGRVFDLTFSIVEEFGYKEGSFPTDQGTWTGMYLGKNLDAANAKAASLTPQGSGNIFARFDPLKIIPFGKGIPGVPDPLDIPGAPSINPLDPSSILSFPSEIADFFKKALNIFYPEFWLRVGKVALGVIGLLFALNILTKSMFGVDVARTARKAAGTAAEVATAVPK